MSQDFRTRYGEMRANDPTASDHEAGSKPVAENFPSHSNTRNILFERSDGRRFFLNYSYLVFCEEVEAETNIVLLFTTHTIRLHGLRMGSLLDALASHIPKVITSKDARYNAMLVGNEPVVNEIILTPNA